MTYTPEKEHALARIAGLANAKNTGYCFVARTDEWSTGKDTTMRIITPKDTDEIAYPKIYYTDNQYGTEAVRFEISTTGYGDHSLRQAQRALKGLAIATTLVETLYTAFEIAGFVTVGN